MLAILLSTLFLGQLPDDRTPFDKDPGDALFAQTCEDGRLWVWVAGEGPRKGKYASGRIYLSGRVAVPVPSKIVNRVLVRSPEQIKITRVTATTITRLHDQYMNLKVLEKTVELDGYLRAEEGVVVVGRIDHTGSLIPAEVLLNTASGFETRTKSTEWVARDYDDRRITIELKVEYLNSDDKPQVARYGVKNWPGRSPEL